MHAPRASTAALLTAALAAALATWALERPSPVLPASADRALFSAERALPHVRALAAAPRAPGSPHHAAAHRYVADQLRSLGVTPELHPLPDRPDLAVLTARLPGLTPGPAPVLLLAHLDTVPESPGASDDAAGVAALLEIARALHHTPPARDVLLAFTDGEEEGLLGGRWLAQQPWVGPDLIAVNLEARGAAGPALLFQTSPDNAPLLRALQGAPRPIGNTLCQVLFERLPHDTDLTPLLNAGAAGLNFAFIEHPDRYHSPHDTPDALDPRSLQHLGETALHLAFALSTTPPPHPPEAPQTFFTLLGHLLTYPDAAALPLALLALLATLAALRLHHHRGDAALLPVLLSAPLHLLLGLAAAALTLVLARALLPAAAPPLHHPYLLGDALTALVLALTLAAWGGLRWRLRPRLPWPAQRLGGLLLLALLAVLVALARPDAAWCLTWPALLTALAILPRPDHLASRLLRPAAAALIVALLTPALILAHTAALLRGAPATWMLLLLTLLAVGPLLPTPRPGGNGAGGA